MAKGTERKTAGLSAAAAAAILLGFVCIGRAEGERTKVGAVAFERTEDFAPVTLGARTKQAKESLFFAEFLHKYGMFQNYLHYWIDRPLYWNRATRPEKMAYETPASFATHARQLRKYMLDGLDVFANLKQNKSRGVGLLNDWFVQGGFDDLKILPIISYGEAVNRYGPNPEAFKTAISTAQADPRFPRIGGKVLVPTYNYRLFKADQHEKFMSDLVKALGNDDFILCGQINGGVQRATEQAYRRNGTLTAAERSAFEADIRAVLDVAGGIQLGVLEQVREPEGPYCTHYSTRFFDEVTAPIVRRILAEPKYAGKVLGFYIQQGYINNHSGHNHAEDGTSTLRRCLRSALRLNPDYLLLFEWNELNENTMFQPTVWNGQAVGRIIRWHSRLMKGLSPDVYPGDDTSVPDLTLSHRATVKVGEVLDFEILNVPDGVRKGSVDVQLKLFDEKGTPVTAFPVETIDETKFGAISYRMSTIGFQGGDELVPVLVADGKTYDGFHPIRIAPTVSWNYKTVRQSLRDRLAPAKAEVAVAKSSANRYAYSADLAFGEKLASVELIADEDEQDAEGIAGEYDRASNEIVRLVFTTPPKAGVRDGTVCVRVAGAKGCRFHNVWVANVDPGVIRPLPDGSGFSVSALIWSEELTFFIEIPKRDAVRATLEIAVDSKKTPCRSASIPVGTVLERGICSAVLNDRAVRVDVRRQDGLTDLPPHLGTATCVWKGETVTDVRVPVFHFRAVSESGRIWRSKPIRAAALPKELATYAVYDEFAHAAATARAPAELIPFVDYVFDPSTGAALANTWERVFDAQLGGGFPSDQAYSGGPHPPAGDRAPAWVKDGGAWCLRFDGTNDYVNLPKEAFPQAAFTLSMEVKPELAGAKQMTLFRHFDRIRGSLSLFIRDGRLFATWGDKDLAKEPTFETGLAVRDGAWNEISVSYDFRTFAFRVNGAERRFPWTGRAWCFKPSIFGGHDKLELSGGADNPVYYRGLLRKLSIRHQGQE